MGFWKQRHLEQAANYFSAPPGYVVCGQCVGDEALAAFIVEHAEDDTCSFCGRTAEEPIAASTDDVLAFIGSSLKKEWDIPENVLFHDSESPTGYFGPTPWTTEEALEQERDPIETPAFAEFVHDAFRDTQWIPRDPYALDEREALVFSWENFAETVKYQTRFVFTLLPDDGGQDDPRAPVRKGTRFLEEIARLVVAYDLISEVAPSDSLYRIRVRPAGKEVGSAADLGAPPRERASQSRMSPAGIAMLYCARDEATAVGETVDPATHAGQVACIGVFGVRSAVRVVDLGRLPPVPSIFDPRAEAARERAELSFLHGFARDLSAQIERDDRIHIDYVPTQVVTQYLRRVFRDRDGRPVQGLVFDSAQVPGGRNVVLFAEARDCVDGGAPDPYGSVIVVELRKVDHRQL